MNRLAEVRSRRFSPRRQGVHGEIQELGFYHRVTETTEVMGIGKNIRALDTLLITRYASHIVSGILDIGFWINTLKTRNPRLETSYLNSSFNSSSVSPHIILIELMDILPSSERSGRSMLMLVSLPLQA